MKILVIFTGGTIGSAVNDGWIAPDGQTKRELISHYEKNHGNSVQFVTLNPYSILSEQLSADEINELVKCVKDNIDGGYDGIIVTHGTDTIQYSASAISYAIGSAPLPVVLVSSNFPLDDKRTNGYDNFEGAVEFIKQKAGNGTFVCYRNGSAPVSYHHAQSLLCHREADDFLFSLAGKNYAELLGDTIKVWDKNDCKDGSIGDFTLCFSPKVLVVNAYPGESYDFDLEKYNAVIVRPYHSGTLNTASAKFENFCNEARKLGKPVFVVNIGKGITYESSKLFDQLGLIPVLSSTFASVYMRLWIAVSRGENLHSIF
ncbi:MAG: asparaginase [Clostridia bacterium]|nr:asparaginase [Clostridia bacterium]